MHKFILFGLFIASTVFGAGLSDLTYSTLSNEVTIIRCNTAATGSLLIPDTIEGSPVTKVGDNAFSGCISLTSVTIPGSVTSIGAAAFNGCSKLTSIIFKGSTAPMLGSNVFSGVSNQAAVVYPAGASGYGDPFGGLPAIAGAGGVIDALSYVIFNNQVAIVACNTTATGHLEIPATIEGAPVEVINANAFFGCIDLTSVTIPASVIDIGDTAFNGCTSLVVIHFKGETAPTLDDNVFLGVSAQAVVLHPSGASDYGNQFGGLATDTGGIMYPLIYSISNQSEVSIQVCYPSAVGPVAIPATIEGDPVTTVEDSAFAGCITLTSVTIPSSVTDIGEGAFASCASLTSIIFGGSTAPTLGSNVFSGVPNQAIVVYPAGASGYSNPFGGLPVIAGVGGVLDALSYVIFNNQVAIVGCNATATGFLEIPAAIEGAPVAFINANAFFGCTDLTSVTIPGSVTNIGDAAFNGCFDLMAIHIKGSTAPTLGSNVFSGVGVTPKLAVVLYPPGASGYGTRNQFGGLPATLGGVIYPLVYLISDLPPNQGEATILRCDRLAAGPLVIPTSIEGSPVTGIGSGAFSNCFGLTSVTISDGVTSIGDRAFTGCSSLTSITIPGSVTSIGAQAFYQCSSLTSITLPSSVTSIGVEVFRDCSSLTSITFPSSVTSIGDRAFYKCSSLTSIVFWGSVAPTLGADVFLEVASGATITYPFLADGYSNPFGGVPASDLPFSYVITGGQVRITYWDNSVTGALEIPATIEGAPVTSIGVQAFRDCSSLTSITIPEGVTSIGDYAFYFCSSLTSITIPGSVTSIGEGAFAWSRSLTSIVFEGAEAPTLGTNVFLNVADGATITYPVGATGYSNPFGGLPASSLTGDSPPEISVGYNGTNIVDGDSSPSTGEGTDFGSQGYSSGSVVRTFRVSNTGGSTLSLGAASSSSGEFTVSGLTSSIGAGSYDDFLVTFDPSSAGTKIATISFSTNDSDEDPFNFTVIGVGAEVVVLSPEISVGYNDTNIVDGDSSPSTGEGTDFGSQGYSSGSVTRTLRVSNTGESTLSLGAASSSSGEFTVSGLTSSISAGSFDDFTVTFDPSSVGTKTATISFSTNDSDENPFNFAVSGVGTEPAATTWYSGASQIQPAGWLYYSWFKGFKPEGPNWIYHGRHGWMYALADDTNRMFLWDGALGRWMFTNATAYPWMYAYGADGGWVFFFEGGRPGARYFKRGDNGQTVSEQQLRVD